MSLYLHELVTRSAERTPDACALLFKREQLSYAELDAYLDEVTAGLLAIGLGRQQRVAIYLPKCFESAVACFATTRAGGAFVPVNPLLKPAQVAYILRDCDVQVLITSDDRAEGLRDVLAGCEDLATLVLTGERVASLDFGDLTTVRWSALRELSDRCDAHRIIDTDLASILYTSGSTGRPKGVVLSHRNMVSGAISVSQYLGNTSQDRLLAVLPFSFDYGFSQLSTAFHVGASVVLMDFLLPRDVIRAAQRFEVTGLAGVPPLWVQLGRLEWPEQVVERLRYITNSGGAVPIPTVEVLRRALPRTSVYLMYGLTEAFRSTYLSPDQVAHRPDSMGKAIPNAEISVVREDGTPCAPDEPGELVHRGALVALGYWNDPEKTAERFRPAPNQPAGLTMPEMAVWSGDTVRMDEQGYLYFVGRRDEMIKTSGYRVSPTELEEAIYATGLVDEVVALGVSHAEVGQAIVIVATGPGVPHDVIERLLDRCRRDLPNFMIPTSVQWRESLPRNPNGKIDRKQLATDYADLFVQEN